MFEDKKDYNNRIDWSALETRQELRREAFSQRAKEVEECVINLQLLLNGDEFSLTSIEKAQSFLRDYQSEIELKSKR